MFIRMVRFWRSTYEVDTCAGTGLPTTGVFFAPVQTEDLQARIKSGSPGPTLAILHGRWQPLILF
jgi:hypothetical protein